MITIVIRATPLILTRYPGGMLTIPWYTRLWNATLRTFGIERPQLESVSIGSDFAPHPTVGFDPAASREAMAEFGWVFASETAIASDLAALPWKMTRINRDGEEEAIKRHPFLDLLANPSPRTPALLIEQQLWLDLLLTGSCYALITWDRSQPIGLLHLPADRTEPVPTPQGELEGIRYDGRSYYDWSTLLYCRQPSWRSDPSLLTGQGHIEALQHTLNAYWHSQNRLKSAAKSGKPSLMISPDRSDDPAMGTLDDKRVKEIQERLDAAFRAANGGAAVVGRPMQIDRLDFSPEELQSIQLLQELQKEILAVTGCVPVRLGSDASNYATALEQRKGYWGDALTGYAKLLASSFTLAARRLYRDPALTVSKDFSGVAVLQEDGLTRLQRINQHILNGMSPKAAYAYEGLKDAPIEEMPEPVPAPTPEAPPAEKASPEWWKGAAVIKREMQSREGQRATLWRAWQTSQQGPAERQLRKATTAALADQRERLVQKLAEIELPKPGEKDFLTDFLKVLFEGEEAAMAAFWKDPLSAILGRAFQAGAKAIQQRLTWNPKRRDALVQSQLGALVSDTTTATRDRIRAELEAGLAAGETTAQLQTRIQHSAAFGASRSLAISRTESTRAVNAGAQDAWRQADVKVRQEWLSSRDGDVRPAHRALDGQQIEMDGEFVVPSGVEFSGDKGKGPGRFSEAGMCVNCRCTVIPVLEK